MTSTKKAREIAKRFCGNGKDPALTRFAATGIISAGIEDEIAAWKRRTKATIPGAWVPGDEPQERAAMLSDLRDLTFLSRYVALIGESPADADLAEAERGMDAAYS